MRVEIVRNCRFSTPVLKNQRKTYLRNETQQDEFIKEGAVSFNGKAGTGAGVGALLGLGAMGLISALSGGLAAPIAYGVYAAVGGVAGGITGDALDRAEKDDAKTVQKP